MTIRNSATNTGVTVAAESISRVLGGGVRGGLAGLVVQPAVWVATGSGPDAGDAFIYGTGAVGVFAGSLVAIPAIITGAIKAAVDDHTQTLVDEAKLGERQQVRNGILPVGDYDFWASARHIQSMEIASRGGVAWQHPNGAYMFIKDANGYPVADFRPNVYSRIYHPHLPLRIARPGRVRWTSHQR